MALKEITGITGKPDHFYLQFLHERSVIASGLTWNDISFSPEQGWLKIWYDQTLTTEQETEVEALVTTCQITNKFILQTGTEYFEHSVGNSKWHRYRTRVKFKDGFKLEPTVEVYDAVFDGLADFEVVSVDSRGFNFLIASNQPPHKVGLNAMQFEWRAWTA